MEIFPAACWTLSRPVNLPNLKLAWDPANYVQVRVQPVHRRVLAASSPYRIHPDQRRDHGHWRRCAGGGGRWEVRETVQALLADGFDGFSPSSAHLKLVASIRRIFGGRTTSSAPAEHLSRSSTKKGSVTHELHRQGPLRPHRRRVIGDVHARALHPTRHRGPCGDRRSR